MLGLNVENLERGGKKTNNKLLKSVFWKSSSVGAGLNKSFLFKDSTQDVS